jgi:ABC-type transport system substrate-binding protein
VDAVKITTGIDPALSILKIQRGQQDMMAEPIPKADFVRLHNDPKLKDQVKLAPTRDVNYLALNTKHPALKRLEVRQAIAMAVDKERLIRAIAGRGTIADGGLLGPFGPFYQKGLAYPHDPEKAKKLLAQAGFADGFKIDFWGRNYSPYLEIGQTIQQDLGQIGIKVEVHQPVLSAWIAQVVKYGPVILENNWEQPYPHGSVVMDSGFTKAAVKAGCCNLSSYTSPKLEKLARDGHRATKQADIVRIYKEMDRVVVRDLALWVPLFYPKRADFISSRVRGYTVPADIGDAKRFANYSLA